MLSVRNLLVGLVVLVLAVAISSCASESAETQQRYTDAKEMWDELNRAFLLPKGEERTQLMYKFINEEWDRKIVENLELYLEEAPNGKYAEEATTLVSEARQSQQLRALSQMRAISGEMGVPQTQAEVDSLTKQAEEKADSVRDTTKSDD